MPLTPAYAIAIPVVAGIIFLALRTSRAAGPLALGAAFAVAYIGMVGKPAFPPANAEERLLFLIFASMMLGVNYGVARGSVSVATNAAFSVALPWYLFAGSVAPTWLGVFAVATMALIMSFDELLKRFDGLAIAATFWLAASGTAVIVALWVNQTGGFLCAALAAGLGANIVLTWFKPAWRLQRSAVPVVTAILAGELLSGCAFGELPISSAVLLALAPNLAWIAMLKPIQKLPRWQQVLICGGLMVIPIAIAVWQQPPLEM